MPQIITTAAGRIIGPAFPDCAVEYTSVIGRHVIHPRGYVPLPAGHVLQPVAEIPRNVEALGFDLHVEAGGVVDLSTLTNLDSTIADIERSLPVAPVMAAHEAIASDGVGDHKRDEWDAIVTRANLGIDPESYTSKPKLLAAARAAL